MGEATDYMVAGFHDCNTQRLNEATSIEPSHVDAIDKIQCDLCT